MLTFDTAGLYLESVSGNCAKIAAIDAVIDALTTAALKAAAGEDISEYSLNDGQVQIKTTFRGSEGIMKSITAMERLRVLYINRISGRRVRLVHEKNFNGN